MIRFMNVVACVALLASAVYAYSIKYQTVFRAEQIAKMKREIQGARDALAMQRAEWAFLTRPERLQPLAEKHLDLQATTVGQIGLTRFINKAGLLSIGDNLFTDSPASGAPQDGIANADGFGDMQQGNLEQANVEVVSEISDLIAAQRAYEMNAKVVSAADQMMQSTAGMFR